MVQVDEPGGSLKFGPGGNLIILEDRIGGNITFVLEDIEDSPGGSLKFGLGRNLIFVLENLHLFWFWMIGLEEV